MGSMIWVIGPAGRLPDRLSIRLQEFCLFPTQDYACAEDALDHRPGHGLDALRLQGLDAVLGDVVDYSSPG